jgi:hypothetical protein
MAAKNRAAAPQCCLPASAMAGASQFRNSKEKFTFSRIIKIDRPNKPH